MLFNDTSFNDNLHGSAVLHSLDLMKHKELQVILNGSTFSHIVWMLQRKDNKISCVGVVYGYGDVAVCSLQTRCRVVKHFGNVA